MTKRTGHLLRILGTAFGVAVTVGNTIGAGILRAPGDVAAKIPSYPVFFGIWIAGGAFALFGALSLAELGTMIPESGGQTVFVRRAFGPYPGFAVAWSDWLSTCATVAVVTIVLVDAVVALAPGMAGLHSAIAIAIILAFTAAQWRGVKAGSNVQLLTSALKALAFAALIVACFLTVRPHAPAATGSTAAVGLVAIIVSMQVMIYTYDGWAGVLYFSGEMENPARDIPRSMLTGVAAVTAIYLLVNAAFVRLIPLSAMAGDPMVADTASKIVFGTAGTTIIRALIAVSLLSAINASVLMASRISYAMGARTVNIGGTPTLALAATTALSVVFLASGTFNQVAGMASIFFVANYAASFASVFKLRRSEPNTPRPYRAWGYPFTTAGMLLASLSFLVAVIFADRRGSTYAILLIAASYPVHRLIRKRQAAQEEQ